MKNSAESSFVDIAEISSDPINKAVMPEIR